LRSITEPSSASSLWTQSPDSNEVCLRARAMTGNYDLRLRLIGMKWNWDFGWEVLE
jgi:hypothetical protein